MTAHAILKDPASTKVELLWVRFLIFCGADRNRKVVSIECLFDLFSMAV
jgi:hypothetical protein